METPFSTSRHSLKNGFVKSKLYQFSFRVESQQHQITPPDLLFRLHNIYTEIYCETRAVRFLTNINTLNYTYLRYLRNIWFIVPETYFPLSFHSIWLFTELHFYCRITQLEKEGKLLIYQVRVIKQLLPIMSCRVPSKNIYNFSVKLEHAYERISAYPLWANYFRKLLSIIFTSKITDML